MWRNGLFNNHCEEDTIMIITGIYDILQVQNRHAFRDVFGGEKRLSITLYDRIINEPNADELAERILSLVVDERGAYKRTYAKRFEEFDENVLSHLEEQVSRDTSLILQDVGISDGRTSCDFFEKLATRFHTLSYHASDYNPNVVVIEKGNTKVTLNYRNRILEYVWPPFVFNAMKRDSYWYYPLNNLIRFFVERLIVKAIVKEYLCRNIQARELHLYAPRTLSLAQKEKRFHLGQHDLLMPFEQTSHIIRAMNVLNPTYFTVKEYSCVIANVHAGLLEKGLLITGSNQGAGSLVHGGIYQKTPTGFEKTWQSGDGSPIEELILGFRDL